MKYIFRLRTISYAIPVALLLAAALPISAFADEGTPPTEPVPATEESSPDSETPVEETVELIEVVVPESEVPAGELPATEPALEPIDIAVEPVAETLADLPEGTEIVVLDVTGEEVSLASEDASAILASSDPIWCPASVAVPKPSLLGCTASYTSLTDLITYLSANQPTVDGTIWIEKTYDSGTDDTGDNFLLNGAVLTTMKDFKLNIKGGWNGCGLTPPATCVGTIDMNDPSELNGYLWIQAWNNDVTISDILFTGVTVGTALDVTTTKNVVITRVDAIANTNTGLTVNNTSGTGNVTITNSEFSQSSSGDGLSVQSNGTITLTNVLVNENTGGYGAYLNNSSAPLAKTVTISNSEFSENRSYGLTVYSMGLVTLANITANENGILDTTGEGVTINNTFSTTEQGVTLTGTNIFLGNYSTNLYITSDGAITASNVNANASVSGHGVYINNTTATTAKSVIFSGSNQFKFNGVDGARIESKGAVTLSNIASNSNGSMGLRIDNLLGSSAVTLTGTNQTIENWAEGMYIQSKGAVSLSSVTANENGQGGTGDGVFIDNSSAPTAQNVTISGINQFSGNANDGLDVFSDGTITVNSVTASNNTSGLGVSLFNNGGDPALKKGITINGTSNVASNNGIHGFSLGSYGPITVNNLTANENGGIGISLYNQDATSAQGITANGTNVANDNNDHGITMYSKGFIKANNLTANYNGLIGPSGVGAILNNTVVGAFGGVTLTGTNSFVGNYDYGLSIGSRGAISTNSITASSNVNGMGANIGNAVDSTLPQPVTVGGTNAFNDNYNSGLEISSYGLITTNNVSASGNGITPNSGYGAVIGNSGASTSLPLKGVIMNGTNYFNGNYDSNLYITSLGPIKVNNLTAIGSLSSYGAWLVNDSWTSAQSVILTGTNQFSTNYNTGLVVSSKGLISLSSVNSQNNGSGGFGYGATLANTSSPTLAGVTLTGINVFSFNNNQGLWIQTLGAVAMSHVTANSSTFGWGVLIQNQTGDPAVPKAVTLSGTNTFNDNSLKGLFVQSVGPVTLNSLTANNNGQYGVHIENSSATLPQKVAFTGANIFNGNTWGGLYVDTDGAISSATSITAKTNGGNGVTLGNTGGTNGSISLLGKNTFTGNDTHGLAISSVGAITLNNVTASDNGQSLAYGNGIEVSNTAATSPLAVTLTGVNFFNDNYSLGLQVSSEGAITASNITANGNGSQGGYLTNNTEGKGITLSGINTFNTNGLTGIWAASKGPITVNNLTAKDSVTGGGADLQNQTGVVGIWAIKLTGTNVFTGNSNGAGVEIWSNGAVSVNNVTSTGNNTGMLIDNDALGSGSPQAVTMTGVNNFSYSTFEGLTIRTHGVVTLAKVTSDGSTFGSGVYITTSANITITCGSMINNDVNGLMYNTPGLVTLKGVVASGNGTADFSIGGGGALLVVRTC